jgi:hypothetical protein
LTIFFCSARWHNGELHNLYSSPDIVRQIKSRRMRWVRHVACMGEGRNLYRVLVEKLERKRSLEDQGVDGRMGSKWTIGRLAGGWGWCGVDSSGSGQESLAGSHECGNEPLGSGARDLV